MTKFNPDIYHRRSIRLKDYDYSQPGAYFVTIATYRRVFLFGEIKEQTLFLNLFGKAVQLYWEHIPSHYANVLLDSFIIMPNHVHGIIIISDSIPNAGAGLKPALTKPASTKRYALSEIVRAFKTFSAKQINKIQGTPGIPAWQRNYYEHIVRNEEELHSIREYIENNVIAWKSDNENPEIN